MTDNNMQGYVRYRFKVHTLQGITTYNVNANNQISARAKVKTMFPGALKISFMNAAPARR